MSRNDDEGFAVRFQLKALLEGKNVGRAVRARARVCNRVAFCT